MPDSVQNQLTDLLKKASAEHHEYEKSVLEGKYDEQWDEWYAAWLVGHGINDLLNSQISTADLADLLRDINTQHQSSDQKLGWAEYTTEKLIDTVTGTPREN